MHEINEQWLRDNGFIEEDWVNDVAKLQKTFSTSYWRDESHRITIAREQTNRDNCIYFFHVDNDKMETLGGAALIYVEEFIKFLECLGEYQLAQSFDYKTE